MEKGRFGFSRWLYPFVSLWMVLVGPALGSVLILGFVVVLEQDEWTVKQCLQVVMLDIYWRFYQAIMGLLSGIPLVGYVIAVVDVIVFLIMFALVLILGLGKLKRGQDMSLPGRGIVARAYGLAQARVMPKVTITFENPPSPAPPSVKVPASVETPPSTEAPPSAEAPASVEPDGLKPPPPPPSLSE